MYSLLGTKQDWGRTNLSWCLVKEVLVEISSADDLTIFGISNSDAEDVDGIG